MRKVLSFVLTLSLVLGSFSMAFAADVETPSIQLTDLVGEDFEQAANTLVDLGVVTGYPDKTFGGEKAVTRAEMAAMVCKALGLSDAGSNSFKDAKSHWAAGWIGLAQSLGVISGYPDGTFKPDNNVTYYEALAMLIKALGYDDNSLTGTWPNKYIAQANKLGISDDVAISGDNAVRGDIAIMLYQTLDQQIGKTNKDGDWNGDTRLDNKGEKYPVTMYILLGMELKTDQLITRDLDSKINLLPYLGAWADYYINSKDKIVAIGEVHSTFITGDYNLSKDILESDVDYTFASGVDTATVAGIFENGDVVTNQGNNFNAHINDDDTCTLAVDLSGKRITKIYSVLCWTPDASERVEDDDLKTITASKDPDLLGYKFPLDGNDDIDANAFYLLGVSSLSDIKEDNIVAVYQNDDKEIIKVEVGTETASGKITRLTTTDKDATIDGTVYSASTLVAPGSVSNIKVDNEVKLFLDYFGDYYDADLITGGADKVGLVLDMQESSQTSSSTLSGDSAQVQLFLADGSVKVFDVKNNVELTTQSGTTVELDLKNGDKLYADCGITAGAVIKYGVNKSGVITSFETYDSGSTQGGTPSGTTADVTKRGTYDGYEINKDAVIFVIPANQFTSASGLTLGAFIDEDDVSLAKLDSILDTDNVEGYYYLDSSKIAAMVINDADYGDDAIYGFVTDYGKNSDSDYYVDMVVDGKVQSFNSNGLADDKYALYEVKFNASGDAVLKKVSGTTADISSAGALLYAVSNSNSSADIVATSSEKAITGTWSGNVYKISDVTAGVEFGFSNSTSSGITCDKDVVVYVKDKGANKYKIGTKSDAREAAAIAFWSTNEDRVADVIVVIKK